MIKGEIYIYIYLLAVVVLSFVVLFRYGNNPASRYNKSNKKALDYSIIIAFVFALYIGFRDPYSSAFGDSLAYSRGYSANLGASFIWDWYSQNFIYDNLLLWMSSIELPVEFFYITIAIIYFVGIWVCCHSLFPNDTIASYLVYLAGFSTYSYGVNGIKAGAAAAFFLIAISMGMKDKKVWTAIFLAISLGFHHSMLMPILAFIICSLYKNPKVYVLIWVISLIIAAFHITYFQNLFVSIGGNMDDKIIDYLGNKEEGYIRSDILNGFRLDFILYSFVPILIGWLTMYKNKLVSKQYLLILNLYTLINSVWMLCMYASYTNRIAYLSWLVYPIVLIYPFLKEGLGRRNNKTFKLVAYCHLAFTLFMVFIY